VEDKALVGRITIQYIEYTLNIVSETSLKIFESILKTLDGAALFSKWVVGFLN
jgi:hypothetical protein